MPFVGCCALVYFWTLRFSRIGDFWTLRLGFFGNLDLRIIYIEKLITKDWTIKKIYFCTVFLQPNVEKLRLY